MNDKNVASEFLLATQKKIAEVIMSIIKPPQCVGCRMYLSNIDALLCGDCSRLIKPLVSVPLILTSSFTMQVMSIGAYQFPLKQLVFAKHFRDIAACKLLAQLMWEKTNMRHLSIDVLVPIPLRWTRYAWRGYNHAYEIAKALGNYAHLPVMTLAKRTRYTALQLSLSKEERSTNVKNAFWVDKDKWHFYQGKHIVIVDDLLTTGSTLIALGKELVKLKPASITAIVACRVP